MKEQLNLAREKAISVEAVSVEAAVQCKGELARLHMKNDFSTINDYI